MTTYKYNDYKFDVSYTPDFLNERECKLLEELLQSHNWVTYRRCSILYGDPDTTYTVEYGGKSNTRNAINWTNVEILQIILKKLEKFTNLKFNCVAIQYYHNGKIGIGTHKDKEISEGGHIFGISLGSTRKFRFNRYNTTHDLELKHGSLYHLSGTTNKYWTHEVVVDETVLEPRYSLTFRVI